MKKTAIMFIIACFIAYATDWLVRKIKSMIRYRRIQRRIDKCIDYIATDEYREEVEKYAREIVDSLDL